MADLRTILISRLNQKLAESSEACATGINLSDDMVRWHQGRHSAFVDALHELAEANKDADR